jgi:hypothetical protein
LQEEHDGWLKETEGWQDEAEQLAGDAVIAAAFIEYLGPFHQDYRQELLAEIANVALQYVQVSPVVEVLRCASSPAFIFKLFA